MPSRTARQDSSDPAPSSTRQSSAARVAGRSDPSVAREHHGVLETELLPERLEGGPVLTPADQHDAEPGQPLAKARGRPDEHVVAASRHHARDAARHRGVAETELRPHGPAVRLRVEALGIDRARHERDAGLGCARPPGAGRRSLRSPRSGHRSGGGASARPVSRGRPDDGGRCARGEQRSRAVRALPASGRGSDGRGPRRCGGPSARAAPSRSGQRAARAARFARARSPRPAAPRPRGRGSRARRRERTRTRPSGRAP